MLPLYIKRFLFRLSFKINNLDDKKGFRKEPFLTNERTNNER